MIIPADSHIKCVPIVGGLSSQKQERQLNKAHLVVATPGRLWDLM